MAQDDRHSRGYLHGIRVVELSDEQGEYAGKVLAGLGADVLKIEPPNGAPTRQFGPFLDGVPHPDRSLHFWHYNFGKRSATLTLDSPAGIRQLITLLEKTDVFLETTPRGYLDGFGIVYETLKRTNPGLVWARVTPFGDDGPWRDYKGSDLVHLALGGVMSCTGYDRDPMTGRYDLPPIAPQMFQAYHVGGQHTVLAIIGALLYRHTTGQGQHLLAAIHEAVSKNTEIDIPSWIYQRQPVFRQTCRHAAATASNRSIAMTKDGRWVMAMGAFDRPLELINFLERYGAAGDLSFDKDKDQTYFSHPKVTRQLTDAVHRLVFQCQYEGPWHDAQQSGQVWAPVRKPEENIADPHWQARQTYREVDHPELDRRFTYVNAPWSDQSVPWRNGPRAATQRESLAERLEFTPRQEAPPSLVTVGTSALGKPFALNNVRVLDFTWWLASGGGPRFLTSLGAEVIKVEWKERWDLRFGLAVMAQGGRAERDIATEPCPPSPSPRTVENANRGGFFNDINTGKLGVSLNVNHPRGKELVRQLIKVSDVVVEGFSPGVMRKWGFDYESMRKVNPTIIYVQQSGMGEHGTYGKYRAVGPIAASLSGLTEMSGLPEPYAPVGIGYSYLDWFGAYNIATAMMAALYRRELTGKGTYVDASQVGIGIYLNGSAILNHTVNGEPWQRYGNRSPWKKGAPAGAYRCSGDDRWIAITCHTDEEWHAFCRVIGNPDWTRDPQFATLEHRLSNQDTLDRLVNETTCEMDDYLLMETLQYAGVPAGVCQTAQDRFERDPQLKHLGWMTDLDHTEMGRWPIKEFPVKFSETPPHMGGITNRSSPCYGEDNTRIYSQVLGLSSAEIDSLQAEGVI